MRATPATTVTKDGSQFKEVFNYASNDAFQLFGSAVRSDRRVESGGRIAGEKLLEHECAIDNRTDPPNADDRVLARAAAVGCPALR